MPEAVNRDGPHPSGFENSCKLPLPEIVRLQRQPQRILPAVQVAPFFREQQPVVPVAVSVPHLEFGLGALVRQQQLHGFRSQVNRWRLPVLDWAEYELRAGLDELSHYREPTSLEVQVVPLEAAPLVLASAAVERQSEKRGGLRAGRLRSGQEARGLLRLPAVLPHAVVVAPGLRLPNHERRDTAGHQGRCGGGFERTRQNGVMLRERRVR